MKSRMSESNLARVRRSWLIRGFKSACSVGNRGGDFYSVLYSTVGRILSSGSVRWIKHYSSGRRKKTAL
eukprot:scaffold11313_cov144-Skeletonema_marinoi.AAC.11